MESGKIFKPSLNIIKRIIMCAGVLFIGVLGMVILANLKTPPAEVKNEERSLRVDALRVEPEDFPVIITGYGEVKALDVVSIASEVSGKIVKIHPRLEAGEVIPRGETLFKVDPRDYASIFKEARATVEQWKNSIARLKKRFAIDRERLKTLERNRDLAKAEFERVRWLFEKDNVGTRSGVDSTEQAFNSATDIADQMAQAVEIYPIQIREAENSLTSARAKLAIAKTNLERCEVRAPFDGRIKEVTLEVGQYVTPGLNVVTLANDAILEIEVSLDSRDARQWLKFNGKKSRREIAWFNGLVPVASKIRWTEDRKDHAWEGRLHRVVKFDQQTRTLTVAIRIEAEKALSKYPGQLPLVEGMFCSVEIPGRTLHNVIKLPRWAVGFENTVYVSAGGRLKTVPVEVARVQGEDTFVSSGLSPGDIVIITRLIDPLENTLLEITIEDSEESVS